MSTRLFWKQAKLLALGLLTTNLVCGQPIADRNSPTHPAAPLTPELLVAWVWERNPSVAELRAAAEAAFHRIEPARSLDDPSLGYAFAPLTFGRAGQGLNQKIELGQNIPWPGTLAAREAVAEHQAAMANRDVDVLRLQLAATTKSAYAEWYFIERAVEIHHATHALLRELKTVAETHYAAGRVQQQDVLQSEVELANLDRHLLKLERLEISIRAQINALLNQASNAPLPALSNIAVMDSVPPLVELERYTLSSHPALQRLDSQVAANAAQVALAKKAFYPDFRFSAGYNSLWDEADKRPVVGLSINIPLDRSKRRANVNSANAEARRVAYHRENLRAQLLGEVAQARAALVEAIEAVGLYETSLLPLANQYLESTRTDYQSGAGSFLSVITAEQRKLATEEGLERTRADVLRRVAELERLTGRRLNDGQTELPGDEHEK